MLHPTLSVKEAADYLKVQPRTVRQWIASGRLPASKVGKSYIITEEEIGKMIAAVQPSREVKKFDLNRKARIAAMQGSLAGTGVSMDAFIAHRNRQLEMKKQRFESVNR